MSSIPISQSRIPSYFSQFNREFSAGTDLARYQSLSNPYPILGTTLTHLNQLQLNRFIPTKTALLLKNNLHDLPFTQDMLRRTVDDLEHRGLIGTQCSDFLHGKIDARGIDEVCEYLYVIMLHEDIASSHNALTDGPSHFKKSNDYSDALITRNPASFIKVKHSLEKIHRTNFLRSWLIQLSVYSTNQAFKNEIESLYHDLKNDPRDLKPRFLELLQRMQTLSSPIESICFKELFEAVSPLPEEQFIDHLYLQLKTDQYYKNCLSRVTRLKQHLNETSPDQLERISAKIQRAYNGCVFLLKDSKNFPFISPTRFSAIAGKMRTEWLAINAIVNRATGELAHRLCSCQSQISPRPQTLAEWPFATNTLVPLKQFPAPTQDQVTEAYRQNQQKTIAVIGCEWGGGHREVSRGISHALSRSGYHPVTVNLPNVLISHDPVRNLPLTRWLNKDWTVASLFNGLLSCKAYAFINLLRWVGSGQPDPATEDNKLRLVLQHLLKINPSSVITTYSADNEVIIRACKMLGIPCTHIATDVDTTIETRTTPPDYKHFYMGLPFDQPECTQPIQTTTSSSQRVITGPPVRHEFTLERTEADILALKQKWGIDPRKKVVVVTSGKNGAVSPFPERLAHHYANTPKDNIPIHLVVLTGDSNLQFLNRLNTSVKASTNLDMTVRPSVPPEEMEELMAMAAYGGGVIGKAGGTTLFEAITRGTRLLCDNIEPGFFAGGFSLTRMFVSLFEMILRRCGFEHVMHWEQVNADFGTKLGVVSTVSSENEFINKFEAMIHNDGQPLRPNLEVRNVEVEMNRLLDHSFAKAETDLDVYRTRQEHRRL